MHKIFVYGTLKRGFPNYDVGMTGTEYLGDFRTVEKYPLVIAEPWFTPNLIDEPGFGHQITGEVYLANDDAVTFLDNFEYVHLPHGYRRVERSLEPLDGRGETFTAWIYVRDRRHLPDGLENLTDTYLLENRYVIPALRPKS